LAHSLMVLIGVRFQVFLPCELSHIHCKCSNSLSSMAFSPSCGADTSATRFHSKLHQMLKGIIFLSNRLNVATASVWKGFCDNYTGDQKSADSIFNAHSNSTLLAMVVINYYMIDPQNI